MRKILIFTAGIVLMFVTVVLPSSYKVLAMGNGVAVPDGTTLDGGQNPVGTEGGQTPSTPSIQNPLKGDSSICSVLTLILDLVIQIGSIVAVLFIIWSGFLFIKAQGKPAELTNAKKTFYYTLIGTAVLLGSSVIANIVVNTVFSVTNQSGTKICNI